MHPILRALLSIAVAALLLPVAFIATILTFPFWRWTESTFQVEAIGHSGPAEWCYWTVYAMCLGVAITVALYRKRRRLET